MSCINLDNLAKLIRGIYDLPDENFDMTDWAKAKMDLGDDLTVQCGNGLPPCGTCYCIAGTAALLQGDYKFKFRKWRYKRRGELIPAQDTGFRFQSVADTAIVWLTKPGPYPYATQRMLNEMFSECNMYGAMTIDSVTKRDVLRTLAALWADPGAFLREWEERRDSFGTWHDDEGNDYWVQKIVESTPSPWHGEQQKPTE